MTQVLLCSCVYCGNRELYYFGKFFLMNTCVQPFMFFRLCMLIALMWLDIMILCTDLTLEIQIVIVSLSLGRVGFWNQEDHYGWFFCTKYVYFVGMIIRCAEMPAFIVQSLSLNTVKEIAGQIQSGPCGRWS